VTEAAVLFQAWRLAGPGHGRDCEAAVLAATHAARMGRGHAAFLPLAGSDAGALLSGGPPGARLAAWIRSAEKAVLAALLQLERLAAWHRRAEAALADLSGRTPALLLALLADWPMLSAPLAEAHTDASRAAIQRNLDLMTRRQLIREITGQGRYRMWTARI